MKEDKSAVEEYITVQEYMQEVSTILEQANETLSVASLVYLLIRLEDVFSATLNDMSQSNDTLRTIICTAKKALANQPNGGEG